jgi:hypothetical protein
MIEATLKIVWMNAVSPTISYLLGHPATCKGEPGPIEPDTTFVRAGDPDHYGRGVHDLAKSLVKSTG